MEYFICDPCLSGKLVKNPFPKGTRSSEILTIIHFDICGPLNVQNRMGDDYFITFIDDYIKYGYVYLIKHKHEVLKMFQIYAVEVQNQNGKKIKRIKSNRG